MILLVFGVSCAHKGLGFKDGATYYFLENERFYATGNTPAQATRLLLYKGHWPQYQNFALDGLDGRASQLPMRRESSEDGRYTYSVAKADVERFRQKRQRRSEAYIEDLRAYRQANNWTDRVEAFREAARSYFAYRDLFGDLPVSLPAPVFDVDLTLHMGGQARTGDGRHRFTLKVRNQVALEGSTHRASYAYYGSRYSHLLVSGTPVEVRLPSGRTVSGATKGGGTLTLSIPSPKVPGTYTLQLRVPNPFGEYPEGWRWGEKGLKRPEWTKTVSIKVTGKPRQATGDFHDFVDYEGTARAESDHPASDAEARKAALRRATLNAKLATARARPELVGKETVEEGRLTEQRYRRTIAARLPESTQVVSQRIAYEANAVVATVAIRVPQDPEEDSDAE